MHRLTAGLLALAFTLLALGCSSTQHTSSPTNTSSRPSTTSSGTPTTTIGSTLKKGDKYVALGSSIASGFGIAVQSTDCGRSSRNYAHLIAAHYGLALTDVTCGAATIPNVVDKAQGTHPPQITFVTPDTKLVTVTVGGNDIGYNATAVACSDPHTVCTAPATLAANLVTTRTALKAMLAKIRAAAPSATIVFVTYPREAPPAGNCRALSYTDAEVAVVRSMGAKLEALFVDVVKKDPGVVFVDPYVESGDHTGCSHKAQRWVAGAVAHDGFPFHPTALGHAVMAKMIEQALGN